MRRRTFMSLAGAAAAAAPLFTACKRKTVEGSALLVDTPEKRRIYLDSLLDEICALGPRPIGSPAYRQSAEIVLREMKLSQPEAAIETFNFERWILKGEPLLWPQYPRFSG